MTPLLQVSNLVVRLGKSFAVGPMDFNLDHGVVLLTGANGSGKTTLLRALAGELTAAQGSVLINGHDVLKSTQARANIGYVPSTAELPGFLSIREAYEFSASLRGSPHWDGSAYCQALELDPQLKLGHASAGQRRKAELVCGLAAEPAVLLLDETFSHLDDRSSQQLAVWLQAWAAERVVILTHHGDPPIDATRTLVVSAGQPVTEADTGDSA